MTREDKILEIINEYLIHDKVENDYNDFHSAISNRLYSVLNFYTLLYNLRIKCNKDFESSFRLAEVVVDTIKKVINKYSPKTTPELALEKEVEVNGVNKKGIKTGKRTVMKFGRWLGQAFPFLTDSEKEKLVGWYFDNYSLLNATFHRATTGFESIVTKRIGKRVGFTTTYWQKSLADSCMRYSSQELGLSGHPYSAYESGDWELCYLLDDHQRLLGRCLVNLPTETHSAIYGVSNPAIAMLKEEMRKLGYTQVSEDAAEWDGSKLLYIEDSYYNEDEDSDFPVHLMPYVDIFEGYAYHDRKYIYLSVNVGKPSGTHYVDPFEASGFNER